MAIQIADGFQLRVAKPLDDRQNVETVAQLDPTYGYEGQIVYVKDIKQFYTCYKDENGSLAYKVMETGNGGSASSEEQIKDWVSGSSYLKGDYIYHEGEIYRCLTSNSDVGFDETNWKKLTNDDEVVKKTDIVTAIDNSSTNAQVPSARAVNELNLRGTRIDQSVIDKYGTEIIKYPFGRWYIDGNEIAGKFSDIPWATACIIDITSPIDSTRNPWDNTWAYRNYKAQTIENKGTFIRQLESRGTPGVLLDTGWRELATMDKVPESVSNPAELDINKFNKNGYYSIGDTRSRTNLPVQQVGTLLVFYAGYYVIQEYILNENLRTFIRRSIDKGANWSAWQELATQKDLDELFQSVSSGKTLVANAITDKGVSTSTTATFATMASNISKINTNGYKEETKTKTFSTTGISVLTITFSANVLAIKQIVTPSDSCSIVLQSSNNIYTINGKELIVHVTGGGTWSFTALIQN